MSPDDQLLLGEVVQQWLEGRAARRELAALTVESYRRHLAGFVAHQGPERWLVEIDEADFERWLAEARTARGRTYAAATLNTMSASVRSFFGWCARRRLIAVDPTAGVARAKTPDRLPRRLPAGVLPRVLAAAELRGDLRAKTMILIAAHLGLRRAELAGLRVEAWDRSRNDLEVVGKGDRMRVLPVEGEVLEVMTAWVDGVLRCRWGPFWPSSHRLGQGLSIRAVSTALQEAGWRAGVHFTPHQLRHTCASDLIESGVDLAVVKQLLGHRSLTSTTIYVSASADRMRSAMLSRRYMDDQDELTRAGQLDPKELPTSALAPGQDFS